VPVTAATAELAVEMFGDVFGGGDVPAEHDRVVSVLDQVPQRLDQQG